MTARARLVPAEYRGGPFVVGAAAIYVVAVALWAGGEPATIVRTQRRPRYL